MGGSNGATVAIAALGCLGAMCVVGMAGAALFVLRPVAALRPHRWCPRPLPSRRIAASGAVAAAEVASSTIDSPRSRQSVATIASRSARIAAETWAVLRRISQ